MQQKQIPVPEAANRTGQIPYRRSRRTRRLGMAWIRRYTHYYRDPAILALLQECGHAALAWLDMILLHLASLWEAEGEQGLEYSISYWLEQVCLLKCEDFPDFEAFLEKCHDLGLLVVERKGDNVKIASPDLITLADEYTKKKRRKQEKQNKRETTRTRLARLEEQVAKLTQAVAQLTDALQGRVPAASAAPVGEGEPSEEEKALILEEFEEKFKLKADDWRKAVILLAFPPKEQIGPGYLARMRDLSQAPAALAHWREKRKTQKNPEIVQKIEEAKVYVEMVRQGFDFQQVPPEITDLVQKILKEGGNGHARA